MMMISDDDRHNVFHHVSEVFGVESKGRSMSMKDGCPQQCMCMCCMYVDT